MAAKRTRKLLVWAICLQSALVFGQITFQKTFGGSGQEVGTFVLETSNGYLVAGHVTNTVGNQDGLLLRLDSNGSPVWQKRIGAGQADLFKAAVATPDGGFVAVGETRSFGAESSDIFIVKIDANGNSVWNKIINNGTTDDISNAILLLPDGGFVISGASFPIGSNSAQTILLRLSNTGNTIWTKAYSSNVGNILQCNYVQGNTIYASGGMDSEAAYAQINLENGNILSTVHYKGASSEALYFQQPTADGNLVLADHTWSANTGTDIELWVQKINPTSGQALWSKVYYRMGNNIRGRIEKINDGGFLLTPYDNSNSASGDALLAKIDGNGNLIWSYNYGGPNSDRLLKAVQTADGGFIAVGDIKSNNNNTDLLIIKTDANGLIQGGCPRSGGILVADFNTPSAGFSTGITDWVQANTVAITPLPINLLPQNINTSPAPVVMKTIPLCPNQTYTINGTAFFAPKMITDTLQSLSGCDTVIQYNLTLNPYVTGIHVIGLCAGETYTIDGVAYTAPATVVDTIPTLHGGCDTLCTFVLKVWAQPTISQTISFCEGESVMIGGQVYNQPGVVNAVLPSSTDGCDTAVTYTLIQRPRPTQAITISFCPGESVLIGGQQYSQPGVVLFNMPSTNGGCDTTITYTLQLKPQPTKTKLHRFCPGESVTIAGQTYQQSTTVTERIPSLTNGCDTIVTHILELMPQVSRNETRGFCPGESITIAGQTYNQPGTVIAHIPSVNGGCDTIVTYTLVLNQQATRVETRGFCPGGSVTIAGQTYNQPGTVIANLPSTAGGCDTVVTYTLELKPQATRAETREFCPGEQVTIAGQAYNQPGTVIANLPSTTGGCDTVVTYTLQYLTPAPSNIAINCPNNITVVHSPGTPQAIVQYNDPVAASDCICPGLELSRTAGPASGTGFALGSTQVCFMAKDQCGQEKPCCFTVNVREESPCDVKVNGCLKYELLSITADAGKNYTYSIRVTNSCASKMVYTAIQVPDAMVALEPANNSIYTGIDGRQYIVRSPNFTPMYSIRFKSTTDSIANGQSEIFQYTLPAQADVTYINITSRLANQTYYEAHLNTFNCPVGTTPTLSRPSQNRDFNQTSTQNSLLLFPNPSSGVVYADLSDWNGQKLQIHINNTQGQMVHQLSHTAQEDLLRLDLPQGLSNGIYFLEIQSEKGEREVLRFMLQR
ncbi:MAG: HYR domain-containing protein [Chitinophagales bacterium]|nr:HYR domain-containing protein [Chitinophagales bacterium]